MPACRRAAVWVGLHACVLEVFIVFRRRLLGQRVVLGAPSFELFSRDAELVASTHDHVFLVAGPEFPGGILPAADELVPLDLAPLEGKKCHLEISLETGLASLLAVVPAETSESHVSSPKVRGDRHLPYRSVRNTNIKL